MKLDNSVLYCKGWYKTREGGVRTMWIDLAHCIHADGWSPQTKADVANWCLHRLDELRDDELFKYKSKINLYSFFLEMNDNQRRAKDFYNEYLDMYDLIILNYRNIISECDRDCFTERIKPSPEVLPVNLHPAFYSEYEGKYYNAEMMCDYQKKIDEYFPDAKENDLKWYVGFEWVEAFLHIDNWEDVLVITGSDNLNDCKEIYLTGSELKEGVTADGETPIDLNIYSHVKNFFDAQVYTCRVKDDGYGCYKLMSVKYE
jgi:hypothetical protein